MTIATNYTVVVGFGMQRDWRCFTYEMRRLQLITVNFSFLIQEVRVLLLSVVKNNHRSSQKTKNSSSVF